jgi:hypothetical protein
MTVLNIGVNAVASHNRNFFYFSRLKASSYHFCWSHFDRLEREPTMRPAFGRNIVVPFCLAITLLFAMSLSATGQDKAELFAETKAQFAEAKAAHVHLLAPEQFARAEQAFLRATQEYDQSIRPANVEFILYQARELLGLAIEQAERARSVLADVLPIRFNALNLLGGRAIPPFREAENLFQQAIVAAGAQQLDRARQLGREAADLYRVAIRDFEASSLPKHPDQMADRSANRPGDLVRMPKGVAIEFTEVRTLRQPQRGKIAEGMPRRADKEVDFRSVPWKVVHEERFEAPPGDGRRYIVPLSGRSLVFLKVEFPAGPPEDVLVLVYPESVEQIFWSRRIAAQDYPQSMICEQIEIPADRVISAGSRWLVRVVNQGRLPLQIQISIATLIPVTE